MGIYDYNGHYAEESKKLYGNAIFLARHFNNRDVSLANTGNWKELSAKELGYKHHNMFNFLFDGLFYGEKISTTITANAMVLGEYDNSGKLISIGITFRGTSMKGWESVPDNVNNFKLTIDGYGKAYTLTAFGHLLDAVAAYAKAHNLTGKDILISGHSQGGMAVNSMAELSSEHWGGFYNTSNYIAFASPVQNQSVIPPVLNIGYQNDPVFRLFDGWKSNWKSLVCHYKTHTSTSDNIISFNDAYAGGHIFNSLTSGDAWEAHNGELYRSGFDRIMNSKFYDLTELDSHIIVSNLSSAMQNTSWVEDYFWLNGPTFIIGSNQDDQIAGDNENDYLEGLGGNDKFKDPGGYNIIDGGEGVNSFILSKSINKYSFAKDHDNTLYIRDSDNKFSILYNIDTVIDSNDISYDARGKEPFSNNSDTWLFGSMGDDKIKGIKGSIFIGGEGNDLLISEKILIPLIGDFLTNTILDESTFIFTGNFGHDQIKGYSSHDALLFMGVKEEPTSSKYHIESNGVDTTIVANENSVTLLGIKPDQLGEITFT